MKIKLAILTVACAVFSIGSVNAADQSDRNQIVGFGSGNGMGSGGGAGSATSMADGFSAQTRMSGAGSQSFGGGFNQQQTTGSGPLSANPTATSGSGPVLTNPYSGPVVTNPY